MRGVSGMDDHHHNLLASAVHQAWVENPDFIAPEHRRLLARYLNLPHATTQAILWRYCPHLRTFENKNTASASSGLVEQWHRHRQRLSQTWQRLQALSCEIHLSSPANLGLEYLEAAQLGPRWWQRRKYHVQRTLLGSEEAFICLYDLLCIFSCDRTSTQYWDGFGMPTTADQAPDYCIHIACAEFRSPAQ